jgi:hypothetical protein
VPAPEPVLAPDGSLGPEPAEIRALLSDGCVTLAAPAPAHPAPAPCVVGDTGWVRESWRVHRGDDAGLRLQYHADGTSVPLAARVSPAADANYEAAVRDAAARWASARHDAPAWDAWDAPALFLGPLAMPRAFGRLHVRVEVVRLERVQAIVDGAAAVTTQADADLAWRLLERLFVAVDDREAASAEAVARAGSVGAALARRWDECQWLSTRGTILWGALTVEPVETATIWAIALRAGPEAAAECWPSLW